MAAQQNSNSLADRLQSRYTSTMTKIEQLEREIERLSPVERTSFRAWYEAFDAAEWDRQIEADVATGKLNAAADAALAEHRAGRSRAL